MNRSRGPAAALARAVLARAVLAGAVLAGAALLASCNAGVERFSFSPASGGTVSLRESPPSRADREGLLSAGASGGAAGGVARTPVYSLRRPLRIPADGQAFAVSYTSSLAGAELTVLGEGKTVLAQAALPSPPAGAVFRYLVPLHRGDVLRGFQLSTTAAGGSLQVLAAGTEPLLRGFAVRGQEIVLDGTVSEVSLSPGRALARLSRAGREALAGKPWRITLEPAPGSAGSSEEGVVTFESTAGQRARFSVDAGAGLPRVSFHEASVGFAPRAVRAEGFPVRGMEVTFTPVDAPLPADPGLVLTWDRASWRRPDFEVFSWERVPRVLVFDTADYRVQDRLFKRLAFFVEKAGFAGRIPSWDELEGLHGYNAHDYRAEDLARFFDTASARGVELAPEERLLARILAEQGVIRPAGAGYAAGEGAVLSISRSSSALLRELLLTHECFHGIYFSLPAFREASAAAWQALSAVEKETWLRFLAGKDYNTEDPGLVVNEFQSYLFQQPRQGVPGFQALTLSRLRARSAADAALVARFLAERPDSMLASFDGLDAALRALGGPPGGRAIAVKKLP